MLPGGHNYFQLLLKHTESDTIYWPHNSHQYGISSSVFHTLLPRILEAFFFLSLFFLQGFLKGSYLSTYLTCCCKVDCLWLKQTAIIISVHTWHKMLRLPGIFIKDTELPISEEATQCRSRCTVSLTKDLSFVSVLPSCSHSLCR